MLTLPCGDTTTPTSGPAPWLRRCVHLGITHVIIGMAGQGLSQNIWPKELTPKWIQVVDDQHHGYSHFTANATTLVFQYVRNVDEAVGDYFVLTKP